MKERKRRRERGVAPSWGLWRFEMPLLKRRCAREGGEREEKVVHSDWNRTQYAIMRHASLLKIIYVC